MTTLSDYENLHLELLFKQPEIQNNHKNCLKYENYKTKNIKGFSFPHDFRFKTNKKAERKPGPGQYDLRRVDALEVLANKYRYPRKNPPFRKEAGRGLDSDMFLF